MYTTHNRSKQLGCQMGRLQMDPDFLMTLFEPTMVPIRAPFIPLFPEAATAAATLFSFALLRALHVRSTVHACVSEC